MRLCVFAPVDIKVRESALFIMNIRLVFHFQCTIFAFSGKYTFELNDSSSFLFSPSLEHTYTLSLPLSLPSFSYIIFLSHRVSNLSLPHILHFKRFEHRQILFSSQAILFSPEFFWSVLSHSPPLHLSLGLVFDILFMTASHSSTFHPFAGQNFGNITVQQSKMLSSVCWRAKQLLLPMSIHRFSRARFSRSFWLLFAWIYFFYLNDQNNKCHAKSPYQRQFFSSNRMFRKKLKMLEWKMSIWTLFPIQTMMDIWSISRKIFAK